MSSFQLLRKLVKTLITPIKRYWPLILLITILTATSCHTIWHRTYPLVSHFESALLRYGDSLFFSYIAAILLSVIRPRWIERTLRMLLIAFCSILFLTESVAFGQWHIHVSPTLLCLFSETNVRETGSVANILLSSSPFWESMITLAALLTGYVFLCRFKTAFELRCSRWHRGIIATSLTCVATAFAVFSIHAAIAADWVFAKDNMKMQQFAAQHSDYPDYADNLTKLAFSTKALATTSHDTREWEERQNSFLQHGEAKMPDTDTLQIALVIGESFIRSHSSVYGYPLPTSPRIEKLIGGGNMLTFSNIISPHRNTSSSIRNILSVNSDNTGQGWHNCVSVPILFKRAGFRIEMFDNQQTGNSSIYSFALGRFLFNPIMTNACYDAYFYSPEFMFDLDFLNTIDSLHTTTQPTLSVYHIAGQHLWASYPREPQWEKFTTKDIPNPQRPWLTDEKRQRIADYDNATYYNDSVVSRIINSYNNLNAIAIYFPDHGEEIFDYRDSALRKPPTPGLEKEFIDHIHRIPFFVWMSDEFITRHPDKAQAIRQSTSRPGTLADVGQMLMGIADIDTPLYNPTRDLFSPLFTPRPRAIVTHSRNTSR